MANKTTRPPRKAKARPPRDAGTPTLTLSNLKPAAGSTQARKRVGRGPGSGLGKTSGKGKVGIATGKANEVSEAVRKAVDAAKRSMIELPRTGSTIPHEVIGQHGAGRVLLKPAATGTGVIAGGPVRAVLECAGITDILTKSLGSTNPHNMVRATMHGLAALVSVRQIARERGIEVDQIPYKPRQRS